MRWVFVLPLAVFLFVASQVVCPDHGVKSSFTGNKRFADKRTYCEYEHPLPQGGVHKFWSECN